MWNYANIVVMLINLGRCVRTNGIPLSRPIKEDNWLNCENGVLLSSSVCLPNGYLKGEVPEIPTIINTKIEIDNIREIDDKRMRITLDFYLEISWIDNRIYAMGRHLNKNVSVLNNNLIDSIWKPDIWIKNLCQFKLHSVLEPTGALLIMDKEEQCESIKCTDRKTNHNTIVTYNMEAQAMIYCNFNFLNYPMDTQHCEFVIDGSYPYSNIVNFSFQLGLFGVTNKNFNVDDYEIEVTFGENINNTGMHSFVKLERCLFPFIIKYYLPCISIITVSLLGFLISVDSIPARVVLLVTQFLTLTNILMAMQVFIFI